MGVAVGVVTDTKFGARLSVVIMGGASSSLNSSLATLSDFDETEMLFPLAVVKPN